MLGLNKIVLLSTSIYKSHSAFLRFQEIFNRKAMSSCTSAKLWISKFGDPNKVVEMIEEPINSPSGTEVLVKMVMAPVNPADLNLIQGVYPVKPSLPAVPGLEGIGVVEEIGPDVLNLVPGDRVVPNSEALGTWRTYGVFKEDKVLKVRNDVDFVELAGITSNPATAYRMLKDFVKLKPGDTIIQNGANSAAGQNVIQLCKIWGINSINIVRCRPEIETLKEYLYSLGATHVVTDEDIRSLELKDIPKPALALNCVGGQIALEMLSFMDKNAFMVTYGGMSRQPVSVPTAALIFKNITFCGYWMTRWYRQNRGSKEHTEMFDDLMTYMCENKLKAPQHEFVPLKDFRVALENALSKQGFTGRKFFLDMRDN